MPKYIKSHSNYVLKSKHQLVNDGTIYERDITTIGAVNQFAPGQIPIYRSGNFIITVRDDRRGMNQYNTKEWEKGADGETWTLSTVNKMVSNDVNQNDTKIVLKNDYYDFREFAYYGSLTELFRASINDMLARFPGELYLTPGNDADGIGGVYYTKHHSEDLENHDEQVRLGGEGYFEISNPFGINIHTTIAPPGADPLKYFAYVGDYFKNLFGGDENGYKNYEVISEDCSSWDKIVSWSVKTFDPCAKYECTVASSSTSKIPGTGGTASFTQQTSGVSVENQRKVAEITITTQGGSTYTLYAYLGDNNTVYYLYKGTANKGIHIRPVSGVINDFYNQSNDLQRIMFNQDTSPKYKATFSVIGDNDYGYTRQLEEFTYPTSEGGYNPAVRSDYLNRLVEIGEFYDEYFTDNLYRSMTHESIKNFDWTYTREYTDGDEIEYVHGGEKIKKALRVFAREFDEVKKYIDNIKYTGRLTYDGRGNVPDYFLSDLCEDDGWDVELTMPYELDGITSYDTAALMENRAGKHKYSQNSKTTVKPYSTSNVKDGTENGYFLDCGKGHDDIGCHLSSWYNGTGNCAISIRRPKVIVSPTTTTDCEGTTTIYETQTIVNRCDGTSRIGYRIRPYFDNKKEYTYMDVNYEFLRRLKLNSRSLWRHKGTLDGIEMILGMFGLKSKRWLKKNGSRRYDYSDNVCNHSDCTAAPDYDIVEYTQFTNRIEESWDVQHQAYNIDWINSTKTITYDYRSVSNYTKPGSMGDTYIPYQGIPVSYREEYDGYGDSKYIPGATDVDGNKILKRYLYPNFNKDEQLDGNPYFQMDGGWLAKTINGSYNFQFDVDNNIVKNRVESNPSNTNGFIIDNHKLYKETVRSIKRVEDLVELLSLPQSELYDGIICFVGKVGGGIAVIDGDVYNIEHEGDKSFVILTRKGGFITIGDLYFDESIVVYDEDYSPVVYSLDDKFDGYEVKAYINGNNFICYSSENASYSISNFNIIQESDSEEYSNYYILDDTLFSDSISYTYSSNGWKRLKKTDPDYLKINTIENYYEGNNGHNGNLHYDSGHEYFTYFQRLFKYAEDNGLFDTRCYEKEFDDIYETVHGVGFNNLIDPTEEIKEYGKYLSADTKVHYYGNYKDKAGAIHIYGDSHKYDSGAWNAFYGKGVDYYSIGGGTRITGEKQPHTSSDDVTNQIVNNKRIKIVFYMKYPFNSEKGQIELKYVDNIVMNYLTQMLPSTVITDIDYNFCGFTYTGC